MRRVWSVLLVLVCASCHLAVGLGELDLLCQSSGAGITDTCDGRPMVLCSEIP